MYLLKDMLFWVIFDNLYLCVNKVMQKLRKY